MDIDGKMIYISKGVARKGKNKKGLCIHHFGKPVELYNENALMWQKARYGFAYADTQAEIAVVELLVKKGIAIGENRYSDLDKYHALCRCCIYANPKLIFNLMPLKKEEKRLLVWLKKSEANLTLPELVCLNEKGIKPKKDLLFRKNANKLMRIIYPWYITMTGEMENKMKHSIVRKQTVDSILELLRKKRIVIM